MLPRKAKQLLLLERFEALDAWCTEASPTVAKWHEADPNSVPIAASYLKLLSNHLEAKLNLKMLSDETIALSETALTQSEKLKSSNTRNNKLARADALRLKGILQTGLGQAEEAMPNLLSAQKIIADLPASSLSAETHEASGKVYLALANLYQAMGNREDALNSFDQSVQQLARASELAPQSKRLEAEHAKLTQLRSSF